MIEDPLFGPLEFSETGCWRGDAFFEPAGEDIGVEILSNGQDPTDEQRQTYVQLGERYASLLKPIARSLFELYAMKLEAGDERAVAKPSSPDEITALTQLNWIEIGDGGALRLGYGFREGVGWDDAVFTVRIEDWQTSGESLDE
jgi:hypothetical protein